jgi:hypothetical protein
MRLKHAVQNNREVQAELARMRAKSDVRRAGMILSDSVPYWPLEQRPIIAELVCQLEEINQRLQEVARDEHED